METKLNQPKQEWNSPEIVDMDVDKTAKLAYLSFEAPPSTSAGPS